MVHIVSESGPSGPGYWNAVFPYEAQTSVILLYMGLLFGGGRLLLRWE